MATPKLFFQLSISVLPCPLPVLFLFAVLPAVGSGSVSYSGRKREQLGDGGNREEATSGNPTAPQLFHILGNLPPFLHTAGRANIKAWGVQGADRWFFKGNEWEEVRPQERTPVGRDLGRRRMGRMFS